MHSRRRYAVAWLACWRCPRCHPGRSCRWAALSWGQCLLEGLRGSGGTAWRWQTCHATGRPRGRHLMRVGGCRAAAHEQPRGMASALGAGAASRAAPYLQVEPDDWVRCADGRGDATTGSTSDVPQAAREQAAGVGRGRGCRRPAAAPGCKVRLPVGSACKVLPPHATQSPCSVCWNICR